MNTPDSSTLAPACPIPAKAPEPVKSWWQRIDEAEARGAFTLSDTLAAGPWTTCACGHQDPRIPRFPDGCPRDIRLSALGVQFCSAVAVGFSRPALAREILTKIEARSTEMLFELGHLTPVSEVVR